MLPAESGTFSDARCAELYQRYFTVERDGADLHEAVVRIGRAMSRAAGCLEEAGTVAAEFGKSLAGASGKPARDGESETILADHIRERLATKNIVNRRTGRRLGNIKLSIGAAEYQPGESVRELSARADAALYPAKREGRSLVMSARNLGDSELRRLPGRSRYRRAPCCSPEPRRVLMYCS